MTKEVFKITGLCKRYAKNAPYAIENINMSACEGEIVGLLGHNGAGKSTALKCLLGMFDFSKGEITVMGHSVTKEPEKAKMCFGFVTDNHSVFLKMTGIQYLNFMADVYNIPEQGRKERIEELDKCFKLGGSIANLIGSYSHGMKQKICMMGSLMHSPKLWILDEPMVGLDPKTSNAVMVFMADYAAKGNCVLFSSHNLDTVQKLCHRAVVLKKGRLFENINVKDFERNHPGVNLAEYFLSEAN